MMEYTRANINDALLETGMVDDSDLCQQTECVYAFKYMYLFKIIVIFEVHNYWR